MSKARYKKLPYEEVNEETVARALINTYPEPCPVQRPVWKNEQAALVSLVLNERVWYRTPTGRTVMYLY